MRELNQCASSGDSGKSPRELNRRHSLRQPVPFGYAELERHNGGILLDVGEGGLAVQAVRPVDDAEFTTIRFQLVQCGDWIEARGRIAWTSASNTMAGIAFVDLQADPRLRIREWIFSDIQNGEEQQTQSVRDRDGNTRRMACEPIESESYNGYGKYEDVPGRETTNPNNALPLPGSSEAPRPNTSSEELPAGSWGLPKEHTVQNRAWRSTKVRRLCASGALILVLTFMLLLDQRTRLFPGTQTPAAHHMGLKLERTGSDLRLTWNPDVPVIAHATKARLLIADGDSQRLLQLDSSDLRGGAILYTPLTSDVVLRLEVDGQDERATASESVRISGGRRVSSAVPLTPHISTTDRIVTPFNSQKAGAEPSSNNAAKRERSDSHDMLSRNANDSARPILKLQRPGSSELPSDPPLDAGEASPTTADLTALYPTASLGERLDGKFEAAQLIARREPVYPPLARGDQHFAGVVQLNFRILTDGTVHEVKVVKGNPVLALAAVAAVQAWRYTPARRDGIPVETVGRAILDFK